MTHKVNGNVVTSIDELGVEHVATFTGPMAEKEAYVYYQFLVFQESLLG